MKAILTDVSKCIGCEKCVAACVAENRLIASGPDGLCPAGSSAGGNGNPRGVPMSAEQVPYRWTSDDGLSAERFTSVVHRGASYVRKQCRHCVEPACASACPVGALRRTPEGPVVYDRSRCLGCRYCMMACPFGIPRYEWAAAVPYVRKCTMCYASRVSQGRQPACTEACPTKATIFGERDALLAEAHRRIDAEPGKYRPRVCGETDVGGTCVLYVSPIDLEFLSLGRCQEARVLPRLTVTAMAAVPPAFVGMGAIMGGLYWIVGRRQKLMAAPPATAEKPATDAADEPEAEP